MTKTITRVAVPAHIYIAVETPDTYSDEQIIAEAKARILQISGGDGIPLDDFLADEHAIIYHNDEAPATIEERNW